jgi:hypothetical protein
MTLATIRDYDEDNQILTISGYRSFPNKAYEVVSLFKNHPKVGENGVEYFDMEDEHAQFNLLIRDMDTGEVFRVCSIVFHFHENKIIMSKTERDLIFHLSDTAKDNVDYIISTIEKCDTLMTYDQVTEHMNIILEKMRDLTDEL